MFINKVKIQNYRLFNSVPPFEVPELNVPDSINYGSGLTVFVGENGCGKTSLLDAIALPLLSYKADGFSIQDINNLEGKTIIEISSQSDFEVDGTMPKGSFKSKGFIFEGGIRARENRAYLSSTIVSDQRFVRADGEEKPKDGSPDLRVNVNNPFKGQRFNENDVLFLDKNRTYQIRSGTYNPTRFDRLVEDFDFQYIKSKEEIPDINKIFKETNKISIENKFLEEAIQRFNTISKSNITLNFIDNLRPHHKCFFAQAKENNQQIPLSMIGAGYEMIFSLLYSFYLSKQSGKQLIALIDEPELHLHPSLQEDFVEILLEFSKSAQIILTTHSPLLVKQLLHNEKIKVEVLSGGRDAIQVLPVQKRVLPYISSNEINYLAFGLPTEEYHNELYEELKHLKADDKGIKDFDRVYFQTEKGESASFPWMGNPNEVSLHTFVRNQIHHQKDNGKAEQSNLRKKKKKMRQCV
ncbi:MAG: ATP-binding protein, partial [Candidatus Omnitrophica bacterium]|nr:ATP-binding protein [Candidatus Omnitrophota bacterium]